MTVFSRLKPNGVLAVSNYFDEVTKPYGGIAGNDTLTASLLMVAGGGSGGAAHNAGGVGGVAGGLIYNSNFIKKGFLIADE